MQVLSRADLERIAQRVLRAYWRLPEAQEAPYRVDPELLAKRLLGLTVRYRRLSEDGELLGLTSYEAMEVFLPDEERCGACRLDGKTVLIEESLLFSPHGPGRRNFTLAHECAHHVMKMLYPAAYGGAAERRVLAYRDRRLRDSRLRARDGGNSDWEEWQMDVLASELLMPEELLRRNLAAAGCPRGIPVLNPVWRREDYGRFTGLCGTMGVSGRALACRLERLRLLGSDQLRCPDAMIDIWMDEEEAI